MTDHGFGKLYDDANDPLKIQALKVAVFEYDFTVDGGAVAAAGIILRGEQIPGNALVLYGLFVPGAVNLVTTNNDGTISLGIEAAGDLMATSAAINANLDETVVLTPVFATGSTAVSITVARGVKMVIATDAITAGKFRVYLAYICPSNVPAT